MQSAIPILKAEAELEAGPSDARLYDVVLAVTGSKERAGQALQDRIAWRRDRGEKFRG